MTAKSSEASGSRSSSPKHEETDEETQGERSGPLFSTLPLIPELQKTVLDVGYKNATEIQTQAIPAALEGRDIIGVAKTGSGKTAAFALPILQKWWEDPKPLYACVIAPTRYLNFDLSDMHPPTLPLTFLSELAFQIQKQFEALGANLGVRCCVIIGGVNMMEQAVALAKRPHIIVATPGRLQDHLEHTKGFSLRTLKYLVLDEADRLLDMDFGPILDKILKVLPKERNTFLFSATMTTKVAKLQRASLVNPIKVEVSSKYSTVSTLRQYYLLSPLKQKEVKLTVMAKSLAGQSMIIFTNTVNDTMRLTLLLRALSLSAIPLHSKLSQSNRLGALNKFRSGGRSILIATDVAARGLDIPLVDIVVNYGIPQNSKDYIHRVGRTARAGRAGKSITMVTQYDLEFFQRIERVIGKQMEAWHVDEEQIALMAESVEEAGRAAAIEMRELNMSAGKHGKKRKRDDGGGGRDEMDRDDDVIQAGLPKKRFKSHRR